MGLLFYHLILVLYYFHVEGSMIADQSIPDREGGIVCGIAKLVHDVYKTLLWLTQTTKNVAYPMTTVMDTNGLYHQLVTPTPRGQIYTWRKIIVWEVVFPEAMNEFKVDADDGMILCMKVVNEQIFRGQALGKSMMSVLKIVCAKYGIAVNIMAQNSETNNFTFVKRYALARIFRTKYYENRSKEYSSRITDRVISNVWTYRYLHDGLQLGDWQGIRNIQQNTLDVYHNKWCETHGKTFAIDWHDYTLNNINVSSKYDATLGLPRTHWIPEYIHTPNEERYLFLLHTMRHQTYCLNFRLPNVDLIHSRNDLLHPSVHVLDHQYIGVKSLFGYFATSLLTLYTMFSDIVNFKTNCNNDTDENNYKHFCDCNTTKTIFMGYHGSCLNACKQKVFNFSCFGSEYWQEDQTWHLVKRFNWWMLIRILSFAIILQCLFRDVEFCPAKESAAKSTIIGGKNNRCSKRKILFRQVIRPKYRRIEDTILQRPKSKTLRFFTRNGDKHINTSFLSENNTAENCMHVKTTYIMKSIQQESQNIYDKHSDTSIFKTRFNNCTRSEMQFRTEHGYTSCEKTFLRNCGNTHIKRETSMILLGDRPDEEQTTLKTIGEEMHPCADDYENTFDTQEATCPMDLGISSRQNSDINENTDELDFSILRDTFNNCDESIPPPDVEGTYDTSHEILTDEMQFSSSGKHSLLQSDISKTFSSSVTSFDGKMSLDKDIETTSCSDILRNSDLSNIEVYGCSFSTRRDVTTVKNFGSPIESPSFEIHNDKREITNEEFKEKKSHQNFYSLIKKTVVKYFDLRLRRRIRRNKSKVKRRIRRFCLRWKKPKKVNHESIQCCPFLNVGNTEDCNQPQTTVSSHPIDEEYLHSHTPPESVGSLSSLFNDISFQSAHDDDRYRYEWFRLASLCHFDSDSVHAIILARNGWYGRENGNETVCYSCHMVRDSWESGDDPRTFHDSNCRFLSDEFNNVPIPRNCDQNRIHVDHSRPITGRDTLQSDGQRYRLPQNNVTTDERQESSNMSSQLSSISSNSSSIYRMQYGRQDISERPIDNSQRATRTENGTPSDRGNQTDLGSRATQAAAPSNDTAHSPLEALMRDPMGINFERPKYPSYAILAIRISSYTDWPTTMTQTPRDMSLAGFFYAGYGDYTRCFFCGGGLRNWEAGDDPWVEHARWFSKCAFVRQNRGQQFIDLVLQRMREIEQQQTEPQVAGPVDDQPSKEDRIMNSAAVRSIKDMGYNDETIKAAISAIKSRLPKGKHKVSAHEILEVVFELIDKDRTGPSTEMNWSRHAERATTTEDQFHNTNITEESKDGPQQSEVEEEQEETASQRFNSLTLNDVESLQRENTSLKDQILCKICMEKNVSIAFLPCGHLACCVDCAPAMRKCPICREFVRGTVKTFLV